MINARLERAVATAAGIDDLQVLRIVQCSSASTTGAIILHAWVGDERFARLVVKTPREEERSSETLQLEWDAVVALRNEPSLVDWIPAPIAAFRLDGADYFTYSGFQGRTMFALYRNLVFGSRRRMLSGFGTIALDAAMALHSIATRQAAPAEIAADLMQDLTWLHAHIPAFPEHVASAAIRAATTIGAAAHALPYGRVHGDFSPYNLMVAGGQPAWRANLIDWEHTEAARPQHLDIFRFVSASALMGRRGHARRVAFRGMNVSHHGLLQGLMGPWLTRMSPAAGGFWLEPGPLAALWTHYLIHAARREQERSAAPEQYEESTVMPGLIELLAETATAKR